MWNQDDVKKDIGFTMRVVDQVNNCPMTFVCLYVPDKIRSKLIWNPSSHSGPNPNQVHSLAEVLLQK